jgi:hypothetical protein
MPDAHFDAHSAKYMFHVPCVLACAALLSRFFDVRGQHRLSDWYGGLRVLGDLRLQSTHEIDSGLKHEGSVFAARLRRRALRSSDSAPGLSALR